MSNLFETCSDGVANEVSSKASKDQAWTDIKHRWQFETCKEVVDHFSKTADRYEKSMKCLGYDGPNHVANAIEMLAKNKFDINILDVGAGTGLLGIELAKRGYTRLDAVDASDVMLRKAEDKNVYQKIICHYVGDTPMPVDDNSYDIVVAAAALGINYMPHTALDDFIRVARAGGHIITLVCIREENWFRTTFEAHMKKLEEQNKWKLVSKTTVPEYLEGQEGCLFIHTIL